MTVKPKTLAPIGQAIIDAYQKLAAAKEEARTSMKKSVRAKAFIAAFECLNLLIRFDLSLRDLNYEQLKTTGVKLKELQANDDIDGMDQLFFGFHSLKNELHNKLREAQRRIKAGKLDYFDKDRMGVWGDLDQAVDMLGRL